MTATGDGANDTSGRIQVLPTWLFIAWCVALPGTVLFAARIVFEQTILTWTAGPQMVGFSLAHGPWILPLLASAALAHLWVVVAVVLAVMARIKGRRFDRGSVAAVVAILVCIAALYVPGGAWFWVTVTIAGPGPHGPKQLAHAAALGHLSTVKVLAARGVPIDAPGDENALHGAAVEGQVAVIDWLLSKGADVNRRSGFRRGTALHAAAEMNRPAAVRRLLDAGADPNALDDLGRDPLAVASAHGASAELVRMLRDAGAAPLQLACDALMPPEGPIQSESVEFDLPEGSRREAWRMEGVGGTIFGASLPDGRVIVLVITFPGAAQMSDRLSADPGVKRYTTRKTLSAVAFPPNRGEARSPPWASQVPSLDRMNAAQLVRHMVSVGDWAVDIQASSSDANRAQELARTVAETVERRRADRAIEVKAEASPLLLRCFEARRFVAGRVKRTICFQTGGTMEIQAQREADEKVGVPSSERKTFSGAWRVTADDLILCEANGLRSQARYEVAADGLTFGDEKWAPVP